MGLADDEECFLWMIPWKGGSLLQEMGDGVIVGGPRQEERREEKSREASDSSSRFLEENKNNSGARSTARTLRRRLLDWSFKECLFVYLGEHMCEEQKGELQDFCVSNKFRGLGFRVNERLVFLCFASIIR